MTICNHLTVGNTNFELKLSDPPPREFHPSLGPKSLKYLLFTLSFHSSACTGLSRIKQSQDQ